MRFGRHEKPLFHQAVSAVHISRLSNFTLLAAGLAFGLLCGQGAARAAPRIWDGGVVDDSNWTTPTNWDGDVTAPAAGDSLQFDGMNDLSPNNNFAANTSFAGIDFLTGASSFTL